MASDENEEEMPEGDGPSDEDIPEGAFSPTEDQDPQPAPPTPSKAVASPKTPPGSYWKTVVSGLPPEKQAAAWQFYQDNELGTAKKATDTLSGMVLLMEANGIFMDACAKRLVTSATTAAPATIPGDAAKALTPVVDLIRGELAGLKKDLPTHIAAALALSATTATPGKTTPADTHATAPRRPRGGRFAPWLFAGLLALATGAAGAYLGDRHARQAANLEMESQVQAKVRRIKTWLDTEEEAKAILMSRKATLAFDFARDPSLKNHKVFTLSVKGVPIVRAGITQEGAGIIAFESNVPDFYAP